MITLLLAVSTFLAYLAPRPVMDNGEGRLAYADPLFLRAASNISHTLLSDVFWLLSSETGELSGRQGSLREMAATAETITVMDPLFFPAIHYYATYMASIRDATQEGAALYAKAGWFHPDDFRLVFNEMVLRLTYEEPLNEERLVALAKRAMTMPEKMQYIGPVAYGEMVEGMMHFAASRYQRNEKKWEDLQWLLKHSANAKRKEEIRRQLVLIK